MGCLSAGMGRRLGSKGPVCSGDQPADRHGSGVAFGAAGNPAECCAAHSFRLAATRSAVNNRQQTGNTKVERYYCL